MCRGLLVLSRVGSFTRPLRCLPSIGRAGLFVIVGDESADLSRVCRLIGPRLRRSSQDGKELDLVSGGVGGRVVRFEPVLTPGALPTTTSIVVGESWTGVSPQDQQC